MNKNELKKVLKPLIKECIKEVLFEETGALSHIISEVANGLSVSTRNVVTEQRKEAPNPAYNKRRIFDQEQKKSKALREQKKKLLDAIGKDAYGGVNVFEGTTPAPAPSNGSSPQGALSGVDPRDPGVDISGLFGGKSAAIYNKMVGKK